MKLKPKTGQTSGEDYRNLMPVHNKYEVAFFDLEQLVTHPEKASLLQHSGAQQCWKSPQEMRDRKQGDFAHGTVETIVNGSQAYQRIWHNGDSAWLFTYALKVPLDLESRASAVGKANLTSGVKGKKAA